MIDYDPEEVAELLGIHIKASEVIPGCWTRLICYAGEEDKPFLCEVSHRGWVKDECRIMFMMDNHCTFSAKPDERVLLVPNLPREDHLRQMLIETARRDRITMNPKSLKEAPIFGPGEPLSKDEFSVKAEVCEKPETLPLEAQVMQLEAKNKEYEKKLSELHTSLVSQIGELSKTVDQLPTDI